MIRLERVSKRYPDGTVAVADLSFEVAPGEVAVLVGPSGCGKTTTMKMINRLVEPSSGHIFLDDEDVSMVDPVKLRRRIGYVIQQVGLFPHMTVADNIATVPRLLGYDRARIRGRVHDLLEMVGLDPVTYRARYPHQLSGGEQQRVGVARALAADPPVMLMDEPFGAIDPIARERLQNEFLRLQSEVRKTVVFVTHDIDEAVKLGDRVAIFRRGGVLEQYGAPNDVLARPASDFVAGFVGADRALKRLGVLPIGPGDLEHPPVVDPEDTLAAARRAMAKDDAPAVIVVDGSGRAQGHVVRECAAGDGTVGARMQPVAAVVPAGATLKQALSELLLHDSPWVVVVDGDRYQGVLTPEAIHGAMRATR